MTTSASQPTKSVSVVGSSALQEDLGATTHNLLSLLKQQMVVIEQLTASVDTYRFEAEVARSEVDSVREQLEERTLQLRQSRQEAEQAEYVANEAKAHAESAIQIAKDAELQTKQVRVELMVAKSQSEQHRDDATTFRELAESAKKELKEHLETSKQELQQLKDENKVLRPRAKKLQAKVEELAVQCQTKDKELEKLRRVAAECREKAQVATQQLQSCQKQAAAATRDAKEAHKFAQRVAQQASQKVLAQTDSTIEGTRCNEEGTDHGVTVPSTIGATEPDPALQAELKRLRQERDQARAEARQFKKEALLLVKKKARDSVSVENAVQTQSQQTLQYPALRQHDSQKRPPVSHSLREVEPSTSTTYREPPPQHPGSSPYRSDSLLEAIARPSQHHGYAAARDDRSSDRPDADGYAVRIASNPNTHPTPRRHLGGAFSYEEPMEALVTQYKSLKKKIDQKIWQSIKTVEQQPPPSHQQQSRAPPSRNAVPPSQPPPILEYRLSRYSAVSKTWGINNE
jgi:myosin heavy subunit